MRFYEKILLLASKLIVCCKIIFERERGDKVKKSLMLICMISISLAFYAFTGYSDGFNRVSGQQKLRVAVPGMVIIHPNAATTAYKLRILKIRWKNRAKIYPRVKIVLLPVRALKPAKGVILKRYYTIAADTPNIGMFNWKIPKNIRSGKYRVKIITLDNRVTAQSAIFSIKDFGFKPVPVCLKVDLIVEKHFRELDYPQSGDVSGYNCFEIRNIRHPGIKFPLGQSFMFVVNLVEDGSTYFSKMVSSPADILTLRNTGRLVIKFHTPDCVALPKVKAIVDSTDVVDECIETNNSKIFE